MKSRLNLPTVVYHADWGSNPKKRWFSKAVRENDTYVAQGPALVGDHSKFLDRIKTEIEQSGTAIVGFDFPIGIPASYARLIGVTEFKRFLLQLGDANFHDFYRLAIKHAEISKYRPFYPHKPGGTTHRQLFSALGLSCIDDLRRKCELGYDGRKPACPLFWTLGANQVGRAAIIGWRDVIVPALQSDKSVVLWPFEGTIAELLKPGNVVIVETYPAEYYGWFFQDPPLKGKGRIEARRQVAPTLLNWAGSANVTLDADLQRTIEDGFREGDDAFDAVVGLFGMIEILTGRTKLSEPAEKSVRMLEGWIFGQSCAL